jgi:hypothetical protein
MSLANAPRQAEQKRATAAIAGTAVRAGGHRRRDYGTLLRAVSPRACFRAAENGEQIRLT